MRAITSTFKSGEPSLPDILKDINDGKVQLPDFQRGWVWDDDHIASLIASISLSYPIGAVMLLHRLAGMVYSSSLGQFKACKSLPTRSQNISF